MPTETTRAIPATGFLRLNQVLQFIPVGKTAWYNGVKEGRYPAPIKLGPRTAAYRAQDIRALIERLEQSVETAGRQPIYEEKIFQRRRNDEH